MKFAIICLIFLAALANATFVDPNACYTPAITSDLLTVGTFYPGLEANLFSFPLCTRDTVTVNLDCSGNGADVSSVSFIGSPIANATFTYYSGDAEVDSDEFVGGAVGQSYFRSDKAVSGVTNVKITIDAFSVFGVTSPCVLVNAIQVEACCEGQTGCAPGVSQYTCQAFADYQNAVSTFTAQFPGVASAGQQSLQVFDNYVNAATQINQILAQQAITFSQAVAEQVQNAALQAFQAVQALASQLGLDTVIQNVQNVALQALQSVQQLASQLGFGLDNPAIAQALQVVQDLATQLGQYDPIFAQALQTVQGLAAQLGGPVESHGSS